MSNQDGYIGTATYSPEDNKLRLYPDERLDAETFGRLKTNGFKWGRFQGTFMAPMWTPARYDLLVELCGEVGDELQTAEERAEVRALRFEQYQKNRVRDANYFAERVETLTGDAEGGTVYAATKNAYKAERTAQKAEMAMENAVDHWSRAEYWTGRVPAVRRHAEWKQTPALRERRIKGLEADERRLSKSATRYQMAVDAWSSDPIHPSLLKHRQDKTQEEITAERIEALKSHGSDLDHYTRWLDHTRLRLAYERSQIEEQGGSVAERFDIQVGGKIKSRRTDGQFCTVLRVNKANGKVNSLTHTSPRSVTWTSQWKTPIEEVTAYEPPTEEATAAAEDIAKASKRNPGPLTNYPDKTGRDNVVSMTEAEYNAIRSNYRENLQIRTDATYQKHRRRRAYIERESWRDSEHCIVFLTDKKTVYPPTVPTQPEPMPEREELTMQDVCENIAPAPKTQAPAQTEKQTTIFDSFRDTLANGGVQTVSADDLYPTPSNIASKMVEFAGIKEGDTILEPSAGTGNIAAAVRANMSIGAGERIIRLYCVEKDPGLSRQLRVKGYDATTADFLEWTPYEHTSTFDRILMNPPFSKGADIKHIKHALTFLRPGGRLVAICANGPRQQDQLMSMATHWEELPEGTFKQAGTMVRTALMVIDK